MRFAAYVGSGAVRLVGRWRAILKRAPDETRVITAAEVSESCSVFPCEPSEHTWGAREWLPHGAQQLCSSCGARKLTASDGWEIILQREQLERALGILQTLEEIELLPEIPF